MATVRSRAMTRSLLLTCLLLAVLGAVCDGRVLQSDKSISSRHRLDTVGGHRQSSGLHQTDNSASPSADRWRLTARRLTTLLRVLKSRHSAHARDDDISPDVRQGRARVRRSSDVADKIAQQQEVVREIQQVEDQSGRGRQLAQQRELAREIEQIERDAGRPSDAERLDQEREIAREIHELQDQVGPARKRAQQQEVVREIEELETRAGRPDAETKLAQEREIANEIAEIERQAGRPSDDERLEQEREIAREIEELEVRAKHPSRTGLQDALERKIASDLSAIFASHPGLARRPGVASTDSSSQSSESQEDNDVTSDVTSAADDDKVYDDFFGDDSPADISPLDESDGDDSRLPDDHSSPVAGGPQGQDKATAPGQGHSQVAHSSWQVTAMTVFMCAIVGVVLLAVVGTWFRDLGYRPFRPGKPEQLLLDDDEQTVYNRTTQPEPSQVGRYSPLT